MFGPGLEVLEHIKQRELNALFIKIHGKQCKIQRGRKEFFRE